MPAGVDAASQAEVDRALSELRSAADKSVAPKGAAPQTNDDIARKGLTKYVNRGDGTYEKAAGDGPKIVNRNDLPD